LVTQKELVLNFCPFFIFVYYIAFINGGILKKVIFIQIIFFLFLSNCFSQTGWVVNSTGTNKVINDIFFVDANTGWVVGDSVVAKSTNGGVNWVPQYIDFSGRLLLNSVKFLNQNTGFAGGGDNYLSLYGFTQFLFKTTNGGINWGLIWNPKGEYPGCINNIVQINENILYLTLYGGVEVITVGGICKSTNGGLNFIQFYSGGGHTSLSFINENTGWTTTRRTDDMIDRNNSKILKTTNGGLDWTMQYRDSGFHSAVINRIQFFNEFTGYAIGSKYYYKTVFYKTTNGGTNWDTISFINNNKNSSLYFLNPNTGWISGSCYPDTFNIAYTTNAGLNWSNQYKNCAFSISRLTFANALTGWAVLGYNSSNILRTTTGGAVYINNISNNIPEDYLLFQNYPNPFNPSTNITYQIIKSGYVLLKIFDVLGRKISTLVNEKQSPGTYEISFDGSNLSSGIYFYKLVAGDFTETKRMVLLK
jgi:photosystem II stability/assembly factor-like uncharacterized protein